MGKEGGKGDGEWVDRKGKDGKKERSGEEGKKKKKWKKKDSKNV